MKNGEFRLKLGDDELILRATPHVLRTILTKHDGLRNAFNNVYMMKANVMEDIIIAGLTNEEGKIVVDGGDTATTTKRDISNAIFEHGYLDLVGPVTEFLNFLGNGGRHPPTPEDDDLDSIIGANKETESGKD